jgi:hypothetical protein
MLAKLTSLAAGKRAKESKVPGKQSSASSSNAAGTPDNVVGLFELGDLQQIQAVLGEVDDPVYKVRSLYSTQKFLYCSGDSSCCMHAAATADTCCALVLVLRMANVPCTWPQSTAILT